MRRLKRPKNDHRATKKRPTNDQLTTDQIECLKFLVVVVVRVNDPTDNDHVVILVWSVPILSEGLILDKDFIVKKEMVF